MSLLPRALGPILIALSCVIVPSGAAAESPGTGGVAYREESPSAAPRSLGEWSGQEVPGDQAELLEDGTAAAPANAPVQVKQAIWAANALLDKPYKLGGGHAKRNDQGYDCSGAVSFALAGGGLIDAPLPSPALMSWEEAGEGAWITVYTNPSHAYVVIAGLRFDTSRAAGSLAGATSKLAPVAARRARERGPRWRPQRRPPGTFEARHPTSL